MQPVTIPKRLSQRGDLVVIPRTEYEDLLHIKKYKVKDFPTVSKREKAKHKAFYAKLDKDLNKALEDYKKGKIIGPFSSIEELRKSLLG
jgi:hypothetical protein